MKKSKLIIFFLIVFITFINTNNVSALTPEISYSSHVQDIGWMNDVRNDEVSGTTGRAKQVEALKIKLLNAGDSSVIYKTHVQDIGWMNDVRNDEVSGTTGRAKQVEALQIKLEGEIANNYDIYYRVHVQDIGWMNYVKNYELAGTTGRAKQVEALQIKLVPKENQINDSSISLSYKSFLNNDGWQNYVSDNQISGTTGKNKSIQLINISLNNSAYNKSIEYSVYTSLHEWQEYKTSGENIGIEGENIEAIKIRLVGDLEKKYDIFYRTHVSNVGWLSWTKNDQISGTIGYFNAVEAIQITLVNKNDNTIDTNGTSNIIFNNSIQYSSHVQDIGWMDYVKDGEVSGTVGKAKKIEAIKIKLNNKVGSSIKYQTYVELRGWQTEKSNDQISGTTGMNKKIEAIKININGKLKDYYDIYYRTHVSDIGWLGWAKNGEKSGSVGSDTQIEAIEIKIVKKGMSAPGNTNNAYVTGTWDGNNYRNYFNRKVTGFKYIDGIKYYFNEEGTLIGKNVKKVVDVSSWQGKIDWNTIKRKEDVDAAIIRVGWGMSYDDEAGVDSYFDYNIKEVQRLGIPYSIYIYAYAEVDRAAKKEANFVIDMMKKYNIPKDTFVWYDAEINSISRDTYNNVIPIFINQMKSKGYNNVGVYGSLNNFIASYGNLNSTTIRSYPLWVAQYYKKIQYPGEYKGWQYTSDGSIDGINGRVDVSMFY